jgi:hypothetical protein
MFPFRHYAEACDTQGARLILHSSWLLLLALNITVFASGCSQNRPAENHAALDVAPPFDAEKWLKWDKASRMAFIVAYLVGRWDGVGAGCGDANRAVRSLTGISGFTPEAAEKMRMDCGTRYKPSNRAFESYESVITDFYRRYPEDRSVEVPDLLNLLASDAELTSGDMHKRIKITQRP